MVKMIKIIAVGSILIAFSACGGGGGGSDDSGGSSAGSSSSVLNCSGVTLNEQNCYLGYIGLSEHDKQCCDEWIATQQK